MLIFYTKKVLSHFDSWSTKDIKSEANKIAHALGKNALAILDVIIDIEEVPNCI